MMTVGAGVLNMMTGAAMATVPTQKALGELSSVGVQDLAALEQAGVDFSSRWSGTTTAQFIAAAYDIKSGISSLTDAGVAEYTRLAAVTGKATKSTTAEMTSLFATGYGIYKDMYAGMSDMDFGQLFSAGISASVKNFKTTGSGMAQAISTLGATAATAKVPLSEQLSILGMLQATMTGGEAGTKYKALMQSAAGAGEALNLQFMDANNQLLSLPQILTALQGKYGTTLDAMEKMEIKKAFGTDEAVAVIDLLYSKVADLTTNIAGLDKAMGQGASFSEQMAMAMNVDIGAGKDLLAQRWQNLVEVIGKQLIPVLVPLFSWFGDIINRVRIFAQENSTLTRVAVLTVSGLAALSLGMGSMAAVLGAAGLLFPNVAIGIASVSKALIFLRTGLITATSSVWGFTTALLANPITWVVLAVIGLIGVLYLLYRRFEVVRTAVSALLYTLGYLAGAAVKAFRMFSQAVMHPVETLNAALGWLRGMVPTFIESGRALWGGFTNGLKSMVNEPVEVAKSALAKLRNLLPFSDAKEGPLSTLTLSGVRMMETIGAGIQSAAPDLAKTAAGAMAGVAAAAVISQGQVPPAGPGMSGREPARIISGAEAGKKEIHIHIGNISLPNAIDAKGFVDEFIKLAEGYDV
jgi:TP901 family phage tail tape measure protein